MKKHIVKEPYKVGDRVVEKILRFRKKELERLFSYKKKDEEN